ncbi:MAG: superoxide dismutase [Rikenellaceae bacterium]|nr:superoxide dismutase [Rikenellaceae bacterium]
MTTVIADAPHFEPKPLPYPYDALSPAISEETMRYHHDKHYVGYILKLNELTAGTPYAAMPLEQIILESDGPLFNNAAQVWNHEFFFEQLTPKPHDGPKGPLLEAINRDFGSLDGLHTAIKDAAAALFGSGWVWLVENDQGELSILSTRNAGTPIRHGVKPLLTLDVWEHAYYIDYRNRRAEAVAATWRLIDWRVVEKRYEEEREQ